MFSRCMSACLLLCGVTLLFIVAGCDNDDSNPTNSRAFSVRFTNYESDNHPTWVILHSLNGTSVVDVKQVSENGIADFGELKTDRVSFTIVYSTSPVFEKLNSFLDVQAGVWTFPWPPFPNDPDTIGTVSIDVSYPVGNYNVHTIGMPAYSISPIAFNDSAMSYSAVVNRLGQDNKTTIYASVQNDTGGYCGWLENQTFEMHQRNTYSFRLDQPLQTREITCSRPINTIYLGAFHDASENYYYKMCMKNFGDSDSMVVHVASSAFPAEKIELWVTGQSQTNLFSYECVLDNIPSELAIPNSSISASFNPSTKAFENISVEGDADMFYMNWAFGQSGHWRVFTNPNVHSQSLPVVPDSILARISFNTSIVTDYLIYLEDFDTAHDFDECLALQFKSSLPWWQRFHTKFFAIPSEFANKSSLTNIHERQDNQRMLPRIQHLNR